MCSRITLYLFLSWANKLDALTRVSTADPEGYLAHPVNAYKLMKRLNTEWSELESLVLQNPADGKDISPKQYFTKGALVKRPDFELCLEKLECFLCGL